MIYRIVCSLHLQTGWLRHGFAESQRRWQPKHRISCWKSAKTLKRWTYLLILLDKCGEIECQYMQRGRYHISFSVKPPGTKNTLTFKAVNNFFYHAITKILAWKDSLWNVLHLVSPIFNTNTSYLRITGSLSSTCLDTVHVSLSKHTRKRACT